MRGKNIYIEWRGRTLSIKQWSDEFNISPDTVRRRLKIGFDIERALSEPVNLRKRHARRGDAPLSNSSHRICPEFLAWIMSPAPVF